MIPEETVKSIVASLLGCDSFNEDVFSKHIQRIDACPNNLLRFNYYNGAVDERTWKDKSRSESWTEQMREVARKKSINRRKFNG